ncbi:MAG: glycosyltransferase [Alloprevotella sp.]
MFEFHFTRPDYLPVAVVAFCALLVVLLYVLRWHRGGLAAKYAGWQHEAQQVEVATHDAYYGGQTRGKAAYPKVSIVVPACNQLADLQFQLPRLLAQRYAGKFEVIVADQLSDDGTAEYVRHLQQEHPNLRSTFVPATSRHIELRKLALTLGIKAAWSDWVIVVNPETSPDTLDWLQHYAENLGAELDFVEAYYNYEDDGSWAARRAILERVQQFNLRLQAFESGVVLGCETANFAVRRSVFVASPGFSDSLCLPFGEEDLYATCQADPRRTAFLASPDTRLTEDMPVTSWLRAQRVRHAEAARHYPPRARRYLWRERIADVCLWLFMLAGGAYVGWRVAADMLSDTYNSACLWFDAVVLLLCTTVITAPVLSLRRSLKALKERRFGLYVPLSDALRPLRGLRNHLSRRLQRKNFVRRYV